MVKKRKIKKKSKKKKSRISTSLPVPQWYQEGLGAWATGDILNQLNEYGLEMDEESYQSSAPEAPHQSAWPGEVGWTASIRKFHSFLPFDW